MHAAPTKPGYARYVLLVLAGVALLNFLDRQIIAILAEPIKRDLGLSDAQVGLMAGLSFAILYTTLGIPIAWLADRWHRPRIIAIAIALWSAMTVACGLAGNFVQLFLARVGVGIGEAGSGPASHSLLSDTFAPEKRAGAFGLYGIGIPLGAFVAYAGGGWLVENMSWRAAFIAAGAPGLLLALIVWLTVKEPRVHAAPERQSVMEALRALSGKPAYWNLVAAAALVAFVAYGFAAFYGAFFVRIHGMGYAQLGLTLGAMIGLSGAIGAGLGGLVADRVGRQAPSRVLVLPALVLIAAAPLFAAGLVATNKWVAIALLSAPTIAATFYYGPTFASVQGLSPPRSRAMASAIFILLSSLFGMGLGPVFSGALSDHFKDAALASGMALGDAEARGIRRAILVLSLFNLWAAAHFLLAARTLKRDLG
jgi:MFS family permease